MPAGTMLGKYEIISKLAMGGMAEIYLARISGTAGFEKVVVLKRILPTVANDPKFVQMFLDEARLAATLRHPNIADVYEVGEHEGAPFFAMEFVHGQDTRSLRAAAHKHREQVPLAIALAIVHGTATALDYAHERTGPDGANLGLVHRDVSTSNILLGYEGAIKLIDFGIARATSSAHQTNTGTLKGKIPYMSPEQCRGQAVDHRSDLFSLGVVFYELTVGRRPFRGDTDFAIMDQIVYGGAPVPSTVIDGFPPALEAIVMRLLARHPNDRYPTAEAMLHELDPFISEHRLFVSPKQMSRYMRKLFSDKMAAWDRALDEGITVIQHLTRTGGTADSQIMTPPASFPAIASISEEMGAVRAPSVTPFPEFAPTPPPSTLDALSDEVSAMPRAKTPPVPVDVDLSPRRFGVILTTAIFLIVFAGGGYAAWHYLGSDSKPTASASPPVDPQPITTKPETKPVAIEKPAEPKPAPREEPKPEPREEPKPEARDEDKPAVAAEPPRSPPKPVTTNKRPPPRVITKTTVQKPPDPPVIKAEPEKEPPKKDPPPKKETKWTPTDGSASDSPFLPR